MRFYIQNLKLNFKWHLTHTLVLRLTHMHTQKGKCFGCIIRSVLFIRPAAFFAAIHPRKKNDVGEKNKFQIEIKTIYNENPSEH